MTPPLTFPPNVDPIERALFEMYDCASTFLDAIHEAESPARLWQIRSYLGEVTKELASLEDMAGEKLNRLGEQS